MCERSIGRTLEHQFIDVALVRLTDESRERDNLHRPHALPVGNSIAVRQARCCPTRCGS
jgi:hypothetical protein